MASGHFEPSLASTRPGSDDSAHYLRAIGHTGNACKTATERKNTKLVVQKGSAVDGVCIRRVNGVGIDADFGDVKQVFWFEQ
jgi:hypothetical protein